MNARYTVCWTIRGIRKVESAYYAKERDANMLFRVLKGNDHVNFARVYLAGDCLRHHSK